MTEHRETRSDRLERKEKNPRLPEVDDEIEVEETSCFLIETSTYRHVEIYV